MLKRLAGTLAGLMAMLGAPASRHRGDPKYVEFNWFSARHTVE